MWRRGIEKGEVFMTFVNNNGKVPYIMVAGADHVSGEMPLEAASRFTTRARRGPATGSPAIPCALTASISSPPSSGRGSRSMSKLFLAALISLLCLTSCTARTPEATPEPLPTLPEETVIPNPLRPLSRGVRKRLPSWRKWSGERPGCPLRYRESGRV